MIDGTDLPPMHRDFARWYDAVELRTDQSHCQARWDGVVAVARSATLDDVEALIRLAFSSPTAGSVRNCAEDSPGL